MRQINDLLEMTHTLRESFPLLTDFEALQICAKVLQTKAFEKAFMVSTSNNDTGSLEALAQAVGYQDENGDGMQAITLVDAIAGIEVAIDNKHFFNPEL